MRFWAASISFGRGGAPLLLLLLATTLPASATKVKAAANPVAKVLELLNRLQQDVIKDGQASQAAYEEKADWCSQEAGLKLDEIKTATDQVDEMESTIEKAVSTLDELATKIAELSASVSTDSKDLEAATVIRDKDHKSFEAEQEELTKDIDMLDRAQKVLKEELSKGASLAQVEGNDPLESPTPLVDALGKVLEAVSMPLDDRRRLTELVAVKEEGPEDDGPYKAKSGGILDVLADMQDKAQKTLDEKQRAELQAKHNFDMLKMSLEDSIKADSADLDEAKKAKASAEEVKAATEGDMDITKKALGEDQATLKEIQQDCMTAAATFEAETEERAAELKALATAKKIIQESTKGGAAALVQEDESDAQQEGVSLLQMGSRRSAALDELEIPAKFEALKTVKALAARDRTPQLLQLVRRMSDALQYGTHSGADPFVKVKKMLREMIEKLMAEAAEAAQKKAFCDKEMSRTTQAQQKKGVKIEDLGTKLDKANSRISELKADVADLGKELADMAKSQEEMNKMRQKEHDEYSAAKADLEKGLNGVETAMKVLRDYYGKGDESLLETESSTDLYDSMRQRATAPAQGGAAAILELLKVAAGDFSKNLADLQAEEDTAKAEYDKLTQENKVTKAAKLQEEKHKKKEILELNKFVQETSGDRQATQSELDAVNEYFAELKPKCVAEPEPFEERQKRREQEMEGLKTAMRIISGTDLLQEASLPVRSFRGLASPHHF